MSSWVVENFLAILPSVSPFRTSYDIESGVGIAEGIIRTFMFSSALWAFSVPLGSVLAGTGAFLYARTKPAFARLTGIGVLGIVIVMTMVLSREYYAPLFGIGGVLILVCFFSIVWVWMRKVAALDPQERTSAGFKLVGYLFWINATWFLCGETGMLHLEAFADAPAPSPIEIMVFLVLGWAFVLLGEYKSMRLKKS